MKKKKNKKYESLRNFIISWDNTFPIDYWWRKKYNISFNSPQHREMNMIDMKLDYEEEKEFERFIKVNKIREEDMDYYRMTGEFLRDVEFTDKEVKKIYDDLDLKKLNELDKKNKVKK